MSQPALYGVSTKFVQALEREANRKGLPFPYWGDDEEGRPFVNLGNGAFILHLDDEGVWVLEDTDSPSEIVRWEPGLITVELVVACVLRGLLNSTRRM
jgi:hypothetical protein